MLSLEERRAVRAKDAKANDETADSSNLNQYRLSEEQALAFSGGGANVSGWNTPAEVDTSKTPKAGGGAGAKKADPTA